jgi:hypothetical protein
VVGRQAAETAVAGTRLNVTAPLRKRERAVFLMGEWKANRATYPQTRVGRD